MEPKYRTTLSLAFGLALAFFSGCAKTASTGASGPKVQLYKAIAQWEEAITYYQTHLRADHPLSKLSQFEFDFKTTVVNSGGVKASVAWVPTIAT